jgi:hypothetical protein
VLGGVCGVMSRCGLQNPQYSRERDAWQSGWESLLLCRGRALGKAAGSRYSAGRGTLGKAAGSRYSAGRGTLGKAAGSRFYSAGGGTLGKAAGSRFYSAGRGTLGKAAGSRFYSAGRGTLGKAAGSRFYSAGGERLAKRLAAATLPEDAGWRRLLSSCRKRQSCTPRARHISAQGKRPKARRFQESPASANQSPEPMCHSPRSRASRLSKPWDHAL